MLLIPSLQEPFGRLGPGGDAERWRIPGARHPRGGGSSSTMPKPTGSFGRRSAAHQERVASWLRSKVGALGRQRHVTFCGRNQKRSTRRRAERARKLGARFSTGEGADSISGVWEASSKTRRFEGGRQAPRMPPRSPGRSSPAPWTPWVSRRRRLKASMDRFRAGDVSVFPIR